jgi:polyribonucleotide nucleotidyltransferase
VEAAIKAKFPEATGFEISQAFDYLQKKAFRISILDKQSRCDGRGIDQIRPLYGEASVLPRTHGSAIFARGETQALAIATLAPADEAQEMDTYAGGPESSASSCTTTSLRSPSVKPAASVVRTVVKSVTVLSPSAPSLRSSLSKEVFPYAIRVSSEVMESNGSTSMASVCSGVMALMDAGVPLKRPVGWHQRRSRHRVRRRQDEALPHDARHHRQRRPLRRHGLQALRHQRRRHRLPARPQAPWHSFEPSSKKPSSRPRAAARRCSRHGRRHQRIKPLSPYAPRIEIIKINPDKIGELIGPGGKNIKAIQAESGAEISIEDDGTVYVYATRKEGLERAIEMISGTSAGNRSRQALHRQGRQHDELRRLHEPRWQERRPDPHQRTRRLPRQPTEDVVKTGDIVTAKCIGIDDKGRIKMSRKAAMPELLVPKALAAYQVGYRVLSNADIARSALLPWHHRDPFDRLLIAHAIDQSLTVVTSDGKFTEYGVPVLW